MNNYKDISGQIMAKVAQIPKKIWPKVVKLLIKSDFNASLHIVLILMMQSIKTDTVLNVNLINHED